MKQTDHGRFALTVEIDDDGKATVPVDSLDGVMEEAGWWLEDRLIEKHFASGDTVDIRKEGHLVKKDGTTEIWQASWVED